MSYPINRLQRVKDLRRVLVDRWGRPPLPDTDQGRALLSIITDHTQLIARDLTTRMAGQFAPAGMSDAELSFLIDRAGAGKMWGPRVLAKALDLTEADRVRLQITTIAAVDCTRDQRKKRKRQMRELAKHAAATLGNPVLHINHGIAYVAEPGERPVTEQGGTT